MAVQTWPASVPSAIRAESFEIPQWAAPPLSTEMNAGTTRRRRKTTLRISLVKCAILMTHVQLDAFKAFHASLGDGADRFMMPVYDGSRYVERICSFEDGPAFGGADRFRRRQVSMTLRVESL